MTGDTTRAKPRWWRWLRLALLVLLLTAGAWTLRAGPPVVCQDAVAGAGTVELCGPMSLADVRVALFALVVAVLLVGEVSELEVAGLVTLKARVAEAQAAAAEVRREAAEFQLAVVTAQATATSTTNVYIGDRRAATGAAHDAVSAVPDLHDPLPATSAAAAAAAFGVAFQGLGTLLPEWASDAGIVAYTLARDSTYIPHARIGLSDTEVEETRRLLSEHLGASLTDLDRRRWVVAVRVVDDAGAPLGALAALVRGGPVRAEPAAAGADRARLREVEAAVAMAGEIYARLLIDLLGEPAGQPAEDGAP